MSRTNKGGARLRFITGLTAAMAIAAGVFAAYGSKPLQASCNLDGNRLAVKAGASMTLTCSGLNAGTTYDLVASGSGFTGLSSKTGAQLASGVSVSTDSTISPSVANRQIDVKLMGSTVVSSQQVDILKLAYDGTTDVITGQSGASGAAFIAIQGLISGDTYKLQPFVSGSFDVAGWSTNTSNDGSDDTHPAGFANNSNSYTSVYGTAADREMYVQTVSVGSNVTTTLKLYDANNNLIDSLPSIQINH